MAVSISKGQKVELTKNNPGLSKLTVGLGWDVNQSDTGAQFDLDAVAFLVGSDGKVTADSDFVYFKNLKHPSGSVIHTGDNLTGEGEGDDETIEVDLSIVPSNIDKIVFAVVIYDADNRKQNFGQIGNDYIRVMDANSNELVRYDLGEDFSSETALVVGEIYRHKGEWKFGAVGSGWNGGLYALCTAYGVNV